MPSATAEWRTPQALYDGLDLEFGFTIDVAASDELHMCERYYTKEQNGLAQSWFGETVWCNPPFGHRELQAFTCKAYEETREPATTAVLLVPVKSDQRWWHEYALRAEVRFIRGRVRFSCAAGCAAFPVAVLVFNTLRVPRMLSISRAGRQLARGQTTILERLSAPGDIS